MTTPCWRPRPPSPAPRRAARSPGGPRWSDSSRWRRSRSIGPWVLADPAAQDLGRYLDPPSLAEPLGRDDYGRSVISRLAHATRLSLVLAALCVATALVLGTVAGIASAWFGGWIDALLRAVSEAFVAIPALLVVLLVSALASGGSLWALYFGLALAQWVEYFRVVRARSGLVLGSPAVEAAGLLSSGRCTSYDGTCGLTCDHCSSRSRRSGW